MHTLHLLRHAKSSWGDDEDDHRRTLDKRGREAAAPIGKTLPTVVGDLDLVLFSTALRAREPAAPSAARPRHHGRLGGDLRRDERREPRSWILRTVACRSA